MSFIKDLGSVMGKMVAQAQEIQMYKTSYEYMSDIELKREYSALKNKTGREYKNRRIAIKSVLKDRGYGE